jgi:hypothetical protein
MHGKVTAMGCIIRQLELFVPAPAYNLQCTLPAGVENQKGQMMNAACHNSRLHLAIAS